ncbi:MAG: type II secretion system F family protein [Cupriavidus sp.]|nr:type II secretion system F family protein [Cupriavidus sp.]
MDILILGFALSIFVFTVLLVAGMYQWWQSRHGQRARRLNQRLQAAMLNSASHGKDASILKQRVLSDSPWLARLLQRFPHIVALDRMLLQSGLEWSVGLLLTLTVALPVVAICVGTVLVFPTQIVLVVAGCLCPLPIMYVRRRRTQRLRKLEEQLPDATDMIGRALRAGHSLPTALSMAGEELPAPVGAEFGIVFSQINYGVPMSDALAGLTDRVPIDDLRYLVIAVLIQRESGGNLAEILDNVGNIIRKRLQLLDKVRVLSGEGRLGARILTCLPVAVGALVYMINPGLMQTLWTDPFGIRLLWVSGFMVLGGVFWMRRIIRIHV